MPKATVSTRTETFEVITIIVDNIVYETRDEGHLRECPNVYLFTDRHGKDHITLFPYLDVGESLGLDYRYLGTLAHDGQQWILEPF